MNFVKVFTSLEEGIKEMVQIMPELKQYIGEVYEDEAMKRQLAGLIVKDTPSLDNPEYPATYSITVSANELGFKTKNYTAFGYKILFNRGVPSYSLRITLQDQPRFVKNNSRIKLLENSGWERHESQKPQIKKNVKPHQTAETSQSAAPLKATIAEHVSEQPCIQRQCHDDSDCRDEVREDCCRSGCEN